MLNILTGVVLRRVVPEVQRFRIQESLPRWPRQQEGHVSPVIPSKIPAPLNHLTSGEVHKDYCNVFLHVDLLLSCFNTEGVWMQVYVMCWTSECHWPSKFWYWHPHLRLCSPLCPLCLCVFVFRCPGFLCLLIWASFWHLPTQPLYASALLCSEYLLTATRNNYQAFHHDDINFHHHLHGQTQILSQCAYLNELMCRRMPVDCCEPTLVLMGPIRWNATFIRPYSF